MVFLLALQNLTCTTTILIVFDPEIDLPYLLLDSLAVTGHFVRDAKLIFSRLWLLVILHSVKTVF